MLPSSLLRGARCIVVHKQNETTPCPDGRASALILQAALPDAEIVEMAYGSRAHRALPRGAVLFCDFSPWVPPMSDPPTEAEKAERASILRRWADAGALILDHHSRDLVEPFGEQGVFGENERGESGAVLAYQHVWWVLRHFYVPGEPVSYDSPLGGLAQLVAVRDTWRRTDPRWDDACALAATLTFIPLDDLLGMSVSAVGVFADHVGPMLLRKKRDAAAAAAASAWHFETRGGLFVAVIPSAGLTSDVADVLIDRDVVAGFEYVHEAGEVPRLQWSLRSRGSVDVRAIARRHEGNGHVNAAGFRQIDDGRGPYVRAIEIFDGEG